MSHRSFLLAATGAAFLSCTSGGDGGDGAGGGLSSLFDSLNGEYQLEQGTDCAIEILGSRVRSLDSKGRTLCQRAGESWSESMQMSGTFSDTRLSGTLEYSDVDDEGFEDGRGGLCRRHSTEKVTITAELDKLRGRSREGRFAGLAGVWEGTLHIEERDIASSDCPEVEPYEDVQTETYHIEADISGDTMLISYELVSGRVTGEYPEIYVPGRYDEDYYYPLIDESGRLEIEAVSGGDIRVDGELVEVR